MMKKKNWKISDKYITEHLEEGLKSTPAERLNWLQNAKEFVETIKHKEFRLTKRRKKGTI